ncbi:Transmembrane protein [Sarcoptes scabiei]|nr:Transmembrane protein [Sarcoptes scabiei]
MMSKSLRELICTSKSYCQLPNTTDNEHYLETVCWDGLSITRSDAYRICLLIFIAILGPLTYARIQKTKIIQIMTIVLRWIAFLSMIGISLKLILFDNPKRKDHRIDPKSINLLNIPKLFGICVYSFMCHHSVPSIVTPIRQKRSIYSGITVNYLLVLSFYTLIAMTAIYAFDSIQQVYTLNFQLDKCLNHSNPASIIGFDLFIPTFPIFTLFSSYTILALTLINNLKVLINFRSEMSSSSLIKAILPMIAITPPLLIALFTEDVSSIVQYVGSYSGTLIQYVFPTLLIYHSRRFVLRRFLKPLIYRNLNLMNRNKIDQLDLKISPNEMFFVYDRSSLLPSSSSSTTTLTMSLMDKQMKSINVIELYRQMNPYSSYFQSNFWIIFTAFWWILCIVLVTLDHLHDLWHIY